MKDATYFIEAYKVSDNPELTLTNVAPIKYLNEYIEFTNSKYSLKTIVIYYIKLKT